MSEILYEKLVETYEKISSTTKRLEKEEIIANFLKSLKEESPETTCFNILIISSFIS